MIPTIKPEYKTTIHQDGTASVWDVYLQQWKRYTIASILTERHDLFASLSNADRGKLNTAFCRTVAKEAAVTTGRQGGKSTSAAKIEAAKLNGAKGGRPRKVAA